MSGTITMYGADWCGDCTRAKALLEREGVAYAYVDVEHDEEARARAVEISGRQNIPVVVLPDGSHLVEPSNPELLAAVRR